MIQPKALEKGLLQLNILDALLRGLLPRENPSTLAKVSFVLATKIKIV
jgi:hypothetical protein